MEATLAAIGNLKKNRAFYCLECGKCTAVCPISRYDGGFSPRKMLADGLFYDAGELLSDRRLWSCLTCQLCSTRCPVDVRFSHYMKDIRVEANNRGYSGSATHGGALHEIMEIAASPKLKQNRTGWIEDGLKVRKQGDVLYFVGCLPYYQNFFARDFDFEPISMAKDTVRILNYLGIEPAIAANERCCGHDLYWLGRTEKFDEIAQLNLKEIASSGAKLVVTACPECAYTLKILYQERMGKADFEVKHITEVLAQNMGKTKFRPIDEVVTFQDPCRLGRYMNIYDQPRQVIGSIPGLDLLEMPHSRKGAFCCGTTNWMNCDATSKQIQKNRLQEAKDTGAQTLVTACPKCQIHFRCAGCGETSDRVDIKITDIVSLVASAIEGRNSG